MKRRIRQIVACGICASMLLANTVYAMDKEENNVEAEEKAVSIITTVQENDDETLNVESTEQPQFTETDGVWVWDVNGWRYQYPDETYATDVVMNIGGKYYSFNTEGYIETGWKYEDNCWSYYTVDGAYANGWGYIGGLFYYFDEYGIMQTGWKYTGGIWYYLNADGVMGTGWQCVDGTWYYMNRDGAMQTGWKYMNGIWYYLKSSGAMVTGWEQVGTTWYLFNNDGVMGTGWQRVNGTWYYMNQDGAMQTGWADLNGSWYYMDRWGAMQTGWQYIGAYKYYFNTDGEMQTDLRGMVSGPYNIEVNRSQNCVTVYAQEGSNKYAIPVKAFLCSTGGSNTPLGTFIMSTQYRWHLLYGAYGQYCSRITGHVLFHSVPYYRSGDIYSLMPGQFNRLGSDASAGCVRLTTGDAKWIYENCFTGQTEITIYDGPSSSPLGRPVLPKIPYNQNWDPTDPAVY